MNQSLSETIEYERYVDGLRQCARGPAPILESQIQKQIASVLLEAELCRSTDGKRLYVADSLANDLARKIIQILPESKIVVAPPPLINEKEFRHHLSDAIYKGFDGTVGSLEAAVWPLMRPYLANPKGDISLQTITITLEGGLVHDVTGIPAGHEVHVHDHDEGDRSHPSWDAGVLCNRLWVRVMSKPIHTPRTPSFYEFMEQNVGPCWPVSINRQNIANQNGEKAIRITPERFQKLKEQYEAQYIVPCERLRDAAPDILAALLYLYNPYHCGDHCTESRDQCRATTAIAKATGRPS